MRNATWRRSEHPHLSRYASHVTQYLLSITSSLESHVPALSRRFDAFVPYHTRI